MGEESMVIRTGERAIFEPLRQLSANRSTVFLLGAEWFVVAWDQKISESETNYVIHLQRLVEVRPSISPGGGDLLARALAALYRLGRVYIK